jgi:hypothetical protein
MGKPGKQFKTQRAPKHFQFFSQTFWTVAFDFRRGGVVAGVGDYRAVVSFERFDSGTAGVVQN